MKKIVCILCVITFIGSMAFGEVEFIRSLKVSQVFDDNIYLDSSGSVSSSKTSIEPSLGVSLKKDGKSLYISGGGDLIFYSEDSDRNNAQHVFAGLNGKFDFPCGISLVIKDNFMNTSDPATSELTKRTKRIRNHPEIILGYKFSERLSADLSGSLVLHDYQSSFYSQYERNEISGGSTLFFQFLSKTSFLAKYKLGVIDYDSADKDLNYSQIEAGITGQLTSKTKALIKGGYQIRSYKDAVYDDFSAPVATLDIESRLSSYTELKIGGGYGIYESFYGSNTHFKSVKGNLSVDQRLLEKFILAAGIDYMKNMYPEKTVENSVEKKREDNIIDWVFGIIYEANEWMSLSADYKYRNRNSNHNIYDYTNNRISGQVNVMFK